jgi:hypothetical protein
MTKIEEVAMAISDVIREAETAAYERAAVLKSWCAPVATA